MPIGPPLTHPGEDNDYQNVFVARAVESFARVTGRDLVQETGLDRTQLGRGAWFGDFALLTHRGDERAMLNYANAFALRLWECNWDALVSSPSAATAPEGDHESRDHLLEKVGRDNFVSGYSGRRMSFKGRLFLIQDVTVWRLLDAAGTPFGVGAFFRQYRYL
jgi:hypothetical protein